MRGRVAPLDAESVKQIYKSAPFYINHGEIGWNRGSVYSDFRPFKFF